MIEFARFGSRLGDHFRAVIVASPDADGPALYEGDGAGKSRLARHASLDTTRTKREGISDAAMPTVGSNLALDTVNP